MGGCFAEVSCSVRGEEFFDQLNDCQLLKEDSTLWN